jgi:hypothetical protein
MSPHRAFSRRAFLKSAAAVAAASHLPTAFADDAPAPKPTLHAYSDYGWLRGFSVVPSWGATIDEAWLRYDGARMREEVSLARQVHANCIRLWLEFTAWVTDPDKVTRDFMDAVAAIDEAGMKTMPCLFNRWHDSKFDYGGTYLENLHGDWRPHFDYVRALVSPLASDPRILTWELCNEPQFGAMWAMKKYTPEQLWKEHEWLAAIAGAVRGCSARQPIIIGTMTGANIDAFADLGDVLCGHPYAHDQAGLAKQIAEFRDLAQKHGKPFLVNESIPGALDDRVRAEVARYYNADLSAAGFGWLGWALREGKAISTRRDRYDANGINHEGFHPFFTKAGKLRDGLEFLTEPPAQRPPW